MIRKWKQDYYAGGLVALIGAYAALQGQTYKLGTLSEVGPGFFPVAIGVAMIFVGALIAGTAALNADDDQDRAEAKSVQWRGWSCILAGPILFIILGNYFGFAPGIFACVFVSAFGDRTATFKTSLALAASVTIFGVALFSLILHLPFPIVRWPHV